LSPKATGLLTGAEVRFRHANAEDGDALSRLAALDEAAIPASPVLLAEVDGEPWAARSLRTGQVIADPFRPTTLLVEQLAIRADRLRAADVALGSNDGRGNGGIVPSDARTR
jgi:hypothetical protein